MDPTQNRYWVSRLRHEARPSLPFSCAVSAVVARFSLAVNPHTLIEREAFNVTRTHCDGNV